MNGVISPGGRSPQPHGVVRPFGVAQSIFFIILGLIGIRFLIANSTRTFSVGSFILSLIFIILGVILLVVHIYLYHEDDHEDEKRYRKLMRKKRKKGKL